MSRILTFSPPPKTFGALTSTTILKPQSGAGIIFVYSTACRVLFGAKDRSGLYFNRFKVFLRIVNERTMPECAHSAKLSVKDVGRQTNSNIAYKGLYTTAKLHSIFGQNHFYHIFSRIAAHVVNRESNLTCKCNNVKI